MFVESYIITSSALQIHLPTYYIYRPRKIMNSVSTEKLDAVFKKWEKKNTAAQIKESVVSGKEKWVSKYGRNPAPLQRMARNYRTPSQRQKVQHEGYSGFLPTLGIKLSHKTVQISNTCCARCTPKSHSAWHPKDDRKVNLTKIKSYPRFGFFRYNFDDIFTCSKLKVTLLPETENATLLSGKVQQQVDTYEDTVYARKIAKELYGKIRAHSWSWIAKVAGWVLIKVFSYSTSGIFVEKKEIEILKQAVDRKLPILYLPLHRSHLDYVILMWVLCLCNIPSPFVAAGDNLNIPILGPLLRRLGAFFIRRRPREDHDLYKAILGQYMIELLKNGCSAEFFLEGRRSRSGMINPSKVGLLSEIVTAVKDGVIRDVLLCPLSITYDKVPEECLTLELQGAKKVPENVFSALWHSLTFPLRQHYGSIKVNFSEPFSLSEYLEKCISNTRLQTDQWINAADMDNASVFRLATKLGDHVLYDAMKTSSVSVIALASVLLLNIKSPTSQQVLEKNGLVWKSVLDVLKKDLDVSFSSGYLNEALNAFKSLSSFTITYDEYNRGNNIKKRRDSHTDLLLHYYSAPVITFSLSISSLCLSIPGILEEVNGVFNISKNKLMQRTQYIYKLLESNIKALPPCLAVDQQLSFNLDALFSLGILKPKQSALSTTDQERMNRAAALWDDSQDVGVVNPEFYDDNLIVNEEKIASCLQIGSVLLPYIKTLWFVLEYTKILVDTIQITKEDFVSDLCKIGEEEYKTGIRPALCTSQFHVSNFVDKLVDLKIILIEDEYLKLSEKYDNSNSFLIMVSYLSLFLCERMPSCV